MPKLYLKIAIPIVISGIFVIIAFLALDLRNLASGFLIVTGLLVVYLFLFGLNAGRGFVLPIQKITEKAVKLSEGDLKSRIYLESNDELEDLAKVFNKVADELEESRSEIEKMEKTVDIKVKAKTQAFQETIGALEQKVKNRTLELEKIMGEMQKFQVQLKQKEGESADLKNQIKNLQEELEERPRSKPEIRHKKIINKTSSLQEDTNKPKENQPSIVI